MDIRIKAKDYELTPDTENYIMTRLATLEKLLGDTADITRCEVEVGRDAGRPRHGANIYFAEIRVAPPGGEPVYAKNNSESVNGAIDDVKEEVERQMRRTKRYSLHLTRRLGARVKEWLWFGKE